VELQVEILRDENVENFAKIGNCWSVKVGLVVAEFVPVARERRRNPVNDANPAMQEGQVIIYRNINANYPLRGK
jgi:hypothetical protein